MAREEKQESRRVSDEVQSWWTKPAGLGALSLLVVLVLGISSLIVGLNIDPLDDANYIVTALALTVSALNVLFTLWLLRTAQKQLFLMRRQAAEQRKDAAKQIRQLQESHSSERQEAAEQLNSLRDQLNLAHESHLAERGEAELSLQISRDAVDEALKTRLDQLAPRVSLAVQSMRVVLHVRQNSGEIVNTTDVPDLDALEGLANHWLSIVLQFNLKNWGTEPVAISLPSPWEDVKGGLLFPGEVWNLKHKIQIGTSNLRDVATSGVRRSVEEPEWVLPVVASDLAGQVNDYYTWRALPTPFKIERGKIVHNEDWRRGLRDFGTRERHYQFLDARSPMVGG